MANDAFFTANTTWQEVEDGSGAISNGTFTVYGLGAGLVKFLSRTTPPIASEDRGVSIDSRGQNSKYELGVSDKLYCRTIEGTTTFLVVPAQ